MPAPEQVSAETWIVALISSASIGITSLVPWLFNMTFFERKKGASGQTNSKMKMLLSFAVGSMLGDIFFHLIPESVQVHSSDMNLSQHDALQKVGLSVLAGIFLFIIVERVIEGSSNTITFFKTNENQSIEKVRMIDKPPIMSDKLLNLRPKRNIANLIDENNNDYNNNNDTNSCINYYSASSVQSTKKNPSVDMNQTQKCIDMKQVTIDTAGYLNLIANGFDNFTHGLAIGASFLAGQKVGLVTTFVVLMHEIPHEICDYAILVKSGFTRWDAVKAQSMTAIFGVIGTATALWVKSVQTLNSQTQWILPFSAGGFLHIALANIMTEVVSKDDCRMFEQITCVAIGILLMALVAFI